MIVVHHPYNKCTTPLHIGWTPHIVGPTAYRFEIKKHVDVWFSRDALVSLFSLSLTLWFYLLLASTRRREESLPSSCYTSVIL
jgi:hypothetical protein